jgi:glutamyl-tRNA synthetase
LDELVQEFSLQRVNRADAVFDTQRLDHFNGVWIRGLDIDDLAARALPYAAADGLTIGPADHDYFAAALALEQERLSHLNKTAELMDFFFDQDLNPDMRQAKFTKHDPSETAQALARVSELVAQAEPFDDATLERQMRDLAGQLGWKAGDLFMPVRVAVTGRRATPPLFATMEVLGRDRCQMRIQCAVKNLAALTGGSI